MIELRDVWAWRDGAMVAEGGASRINHLLAESLTEIGIHPVDGAWRKLYRHKETRRLWELDYPQSEMHGGGPRRLRELELIEPADWSKHGSS
jgi:hypothetical protein